MNINVWDETVCKEIPKWPGYRVSKDGRVFSMRRKVVRELSENPQGQIALHKGGKSKWYYVATVVLMAWSAKRKPHNKSIPYFKDGDPKNRHIDNLEWRPRKKHHWTIISEEGIKEIKALADQGMPMRQIARKTKVDYKHVWDIVNGKTRSYID